MSVVDHVFHPEGEATIEQVLQSSDGVRGRLKEGHNAGRVGRVQEDDSCEKNEQNYPAGHALSLHRCACEDKIKTGLQEIVG